MQVHAAMIDQIDQNIGRVLRKLDELGKSDNTLIVFLSDNGANSLTYGDPDPDFRGGPGTGVALGQNWAMASNSPFKGYKSSNFEGGGHTPAIFSWPEKIAPGSFDRDLAHVMDITATCLDLAGSVPVSTNCPWP